MVFESPAQPAPRGQRIVLATYGSRGDLHPFLAIALGLQERGHTPVVAANPEHRRQVAASGIDFHPVRPAFETEGEAWERLIDPVKGPEYLLRDVLLASLRDSYTDLDAICIDADLLVTHSLVLAGPLVAETRRAAGLRWASAAIGPSVFFSAHEPSVLAPAPDLVRLRPLIGAGGYARVLTLIKNSARTWAEPWHTLRAELGLPAVTADPLFGGQFSPERTLALFPRLFAAPQPDWPTGVVVTGFPFLEETQSPLDPALAAFLDDGEPPLVFTLGTTMVRAAGDFYAVAAEAARQSGRRALLLTGSDARNSPMALPDGCFAAAYAPYARVLPRAAAVVQQGGIGTTAQALRAGVPMLVVPFGFDQFDNAARAIRLGVARTIRRRDFTPERAARELSTLLSRPDYGRKAAEVGQMLRAQDGVETACDALEAMLRR